MDIMKRSELRDMIREVINEGTVEKDLLSTEQGYVYKITMDKGQIVYYERVGQNARGPLFKYFDIKTGKTKGKAAELYAPSIKSVSRWKEIG